MMRDYGIGLGGMFFPGFGIFLQLIIFIGFLTIIYWVIKSGNNGKASLSPEEILKIRLAKGEITKKEYQDLKKELEK